MSMDQGDLPERSSSWFRDGLTRREFVVRGARTLGGVTAVPLLVSCFAADEPETAAAEAKATYLNPLVPPGLDVDGPTINVPVSQATADALYRRLVTFQFTPAEGGVLIPDLTKPVVPELAEDFDNDGLRWRFRLREGIVSAVGNELTADDVVYSWARYKSVSGAAPNGWFFGTVSGIFPDQVPETTAEKKLQTTEVRKLDKYTVELNQRKPTLLFPMALSILATAIFDSQEMEKRSTPQDPWTHEWCDTQGSAGFAPYSIAEWRKGSELVLEKNPNWDLPGLTKPLVNEWTIKQVPSPSVRLQSVLAGDADVTDTLTPRDYEFAADKPGVTVPGVFGNVSPYVLMNFQVKPFDNIPLRQAIAFAIPYEDIIEVGYFGHARRWHSITPKLFRDYKEVRLYDTDLERARSLLEQAGFPDGDGLSQYEDAFQLIYDADRQDVLQPIVLLIQDSLRQIGIPVRLNPIPSAQFQTRASVHHDLPFAFNDQQKSDVFDAGYNIQLSFLSTEAGGLNNQPNYSNPRVDSLWNDHAKSETDPARRTEQLGEIQEICMRDVAWLPVCEPEFQILLNREFGNYHWFSNLLQMQYLGPKDAIPGS